MGKRLSREEDLTADDEWFGGPITCAAGCLYSSIIEVYKVYKVYKRHCWGCFGLCKKI